MEKTNNFDNIENVANNFSGLVIPTICILLSLLGLTTVIYGCYEYKKKVKSKGLLYFGIGIGMADSGLIFFLLMVISNNLHNFTETNKETNIFALVALLLFFVACWFVSLSKRISDTN